MKFYDKYPRVVDRSVANQVTQRKPNKTGLPDSLKLGIENLSGHSMDDVKVHYNSSRPAQLHAHAFAQGNQIHLASGQEKHLPHEAWHVVQQKQGRVKPTMQLKSSVLINDDSRLKSEYGKSLTVQFAENTVNRTIVKDDSEEGSLWDMLCKASPLFLEGALAIVAGWHTRGNGKDAKANTAASFLISSGVTKIVRGITVALNTKLGKKSRFHPILSLMINGLRTYESIFSTMGASYAINWLLYFASLIKMIRSGLIMAILYLKSNSTTQKDKEDKKKLMYTNNILHVFETILTMTAAILFSEKSALLAATTGTTTASKAFRIEQQRREDNEEIERDDKERRKKLSTDSEYANSKYL